MKLNLHANPAQTAVALLLSLLAICSLAQGEIPEDALLPERQVNEIFDIANEEYKAGNYENAVSMYEGILSTFAIRNADIHYNMGNAHFKLGHYGKAIASYRRALQISPREQDILANLRLARNMARDKLDSPKSTELLREIFFFHYEFSKMESECIFLIMYCVGVLAGVVALLKKSRAARWTAFGALAVMVVFGLSSLVHTYRQARPSEAVVIAAEAGVRTGPGETYLVSFSLHDGAELEISKTLDGWHQIELSDGRRGWIKDADMEII
ncbi:MAG: tetratricopeptide repeat protein [Candidatus Abyssobacteria bacterium SURF_5]|uniref:Tetratricopeptide repeat protein n=1 Tax=Abyssobacteria bacterium (strain SURF_5) TaxID=2093360 RepID=A0A3A4P3P0_ABYX5|nr:MAG: tetratricopeptide repeat protein [Candidatus Abyssubacteria bacterium SURF_5]